MAAPPDHAAEPRQRWRLVVARDRAMDVTQRDVAAVWMAAIEAAGLPLAGSEGQRGRSRIAFGAPLPVGMTAERELIDVVDVWLGGPPLAGRVAAADYRIDLGEVEDIPALQRAAAELSAASRIPRQRLKGGATVGYDLRPLLADVAVDPGPPAIVRTRTRFDPELGTGRPEEVVGALSDRLGVPLTPRSIVRERLLLDEDLRWIVARSTHD